MTPPVAVLVSGPPATGKSTLAHALAPRLGAAILDLDVATGPLVGVVSDLIGVRDLNDPALARLTRDARYDALLALASDNLRAGRPVVLVAPFSAERSQPSAWAATVARIAAEPVLLWLHLPPAELVRRLAGRALPRDEDKIGAPGSYLAGLDLAPPVVPHLALDATQPVGTLVRSVQRHLAKRQLRDT
jgi:predicted kinase